MSGPAAALLRWQFWHPHGLLEAAVGRLTPDAVPHAAAGYARAVLCEDIGVNGVLAGRSPLALSTWARRTGLTPLPALGAPIDWRAWARTVRLDLPSVRPYACAVHDAADACLAGLPDEALALGPAATPACVLTGLLLKVSMRRGEIAILAPADES